MIERSGVNDPESRQSTGGKKSVFDFDHKHYVAILKGRAGEFRALREMADARTDFTPMIDVPPFDWDFVKEQNKKSVDEHLRRLPGAIAKCWGVGRSIFIDLYMIQDVDRTQDGRHPLAAVFDALRKLSDREVFFPDAIRAIPVIGLNRSTHQRK
jgi:T4 beta protein